MTTMNFNPVDYWVDGEDIVDAEAPTVGVDRVRQTRQLQARLISPASRRKLSVIIISADSVSGAAAAVLGEVDCNVLNFYYQDSPRRVHLIAAQGGISAAKNYHNDNDSTYRLFCDMVKSGDYRTRETNIYRLAEVSVDIIDRRVARDVPFAREYGDLLDTRSFGGVQMRRTFYARDQTGQQLLIGRYQQLERQIEVDTVKMYSCYKMAELTVTDGCARGIITHSMVSDEIKAWATDTVVLGIGGYGNVFFLSTNAMGYNAAAAWRTHCKGAYSRNPCYVQIHPTCVPMHGGTQPKLALILESLRNDGCIWAPEKAVDCAKDPRSIPEENHDYYLEQVYPAPGDLAPRDTASHQTKNMCDEGREVSPVVTEKQTDGTTEQVRRGIYLDFSGAVNRLGKDGVSSRYGNLLDMYQQVTSEDPYEVSMRAYPAVHCTMGGIRVDYDPQSAILGLYVTGETNFPDHDTNRLGVLALMQGLVDGYFVLPNTIDDYLTDDPLKKVSEKHPAAVEAVQTTVARFYKLLSIQDTRSVDSFHEEPGQIMWGYCGINRTEERPIKAIGLIREPREEYWHNAYVTSVNEDFNQTLEHAERVTDFFELGELMYTDTLYRHGPCGDHFQAKSQTGRGEALRHDDEFLYVTVWGWTDEDNKPILHRESLVYEIIGLKQRSYK